MTEMIRRRTLPDSLRWLADKLEAGTETERVGVALTLHALADEIHRLVEPCNAPGDAPNSLGTERCKLPAGHEGRHEEGTTGWPQRKPERPVSGEEKNA